MVCGLRLALFVGSVVASNGLKDLIFLNTTDGANLLKAASHSGPFWQLSPHAAAELPGMCGPTTATMILNALSTKGLQAPISTIYSYHFAQYQQDFRYWDHVNIWNGSDSTCVNKSTTPWKGSLEQVGAIMRCHGASVYSLLAAQITLADFRSTITRAFSAEPLQYIAVNFLRGALNQQGIGHHSPVVAYDSVTDRALVFDVATYKYPPWWVDLEDLFLAMAAKDAQPFSTPRGLLVVGMNKSRAEIDRNEHQPIQV